MISIIDLFSIIEKTSVNIKSIYLPLEQLIGKFLAEDIYAEHDSPPFRQAAMDGYGVKMSDLEENTPLPVSGESSAGKSNFTQRSENSILPIYTGAIVPDDVEAIITLEQTEKTALGILLKDKIEKGANIRPKGSQFAKGELLLEAGCHLGPAHIGLLAMNGLKGANVVEQPKIKIIVTGNELTKPGEKLPPAGVYESNSYMLLSACQAGGFENVQLCSLEDNLEQIEQCIKEALLQYDMIILSGGISVGKYDYVKRAIQSNGVEELFYKVKQKPGKPLYMGQKDQCYVFGLPGNPAAALTCFYLYAYPLLKRISGQKNISETKELKKIQGSYTKKSGLTHFLKGFVKEETVHILHDQESYKITSYAEANCLIIIPEMSEKINTGETVEIIRLPNL